MHNINIKDEIDGYNINELIIYFTKVKAELEANNIDPTSVKLNVFMEQEPYTDSEYPQVELYNSFSKDISCVYNADHGCNY